MGQLKDCKPGSCDYWAVSKAAVALSNQACTVAARHITDGSLRLQFNREVSYYARGIVNDVAQGRKTAEQGLDAIKAEQRSLLSQSKEVAQRGVGVIAGALQVVGGAGICYGSAGTLCVFIGAPMVLHGSNNIYENGRNLWENRTDVEGPVRKVYHRIAKGLNKSDVEGNLMYGSADLIMSAYGAGRLVLKPDAWRLYRYVRKDYVRAYQNTPKSISLLERTADTITVKDMVEQMESKK
ncbi:DUF4225 domain-containing protein [Pseudomonas sp. SZMC_28357]|uniref:DUF4225 domain-containing protein n=1 Tax=Pseudomonas sp. SZMC_28357 TaxID=3074380 RepID=UPI002870D3EF|nr:DUF4225 domain-containing protein [Pseudomonas sp. SZMC_28357]MDR9750221.1 DUF4225 domain-containing protein [Pseudomonas sp. SZMC_28357]